MVNHQVGQDQRCGATHAHRAVHQHLSCRWEKTNKNLLVAQSSYQLSEGGSWCFYLLKSEPGE